MTLQLTTRPSTPPPASPRSTDSLAFQDFWSDLPRDGLIPRRKNFSPSKAAAFLRDIVLIEARCDSPLRVRVTGSAFDARAGKSIVGQNYLEFVPEHLHEGLLKSVRLMLDHPCGLWQLMPIHYEKGIAQQAEVTAFPLLPADDCIPLLLCLVKFPGRPVTPLDASGKVMIVETATDYEFLDVGNGSPQYLA